MMILEDELNFFFQKSFFFQSFVTFVDIEQHFMNNGHIWCNLPVYNYNTYTSLLP